MSFQCSPDKNIMLNFHSVNLLKFKLLERSVSVNKSKDWEFSLSVNTFGSILPWPVPRLLTYGLIGIRFRFVVMYDIEFKLDDYLLQ